VTCGYCHTATRIRETRQQPRVEPRAHRPPSPTRAISLAMAGVVVSGAVAVVLFRSARQAATPQLATTEPATSPPVAIATPPIDDNPEVVHDAGVAADAAIVEALPAPAKRPKPAAPVYTGPIVTKQEAEKILRPELLTCMKQHGVHYLITRLGNERRGANVPPLGIVDTSVVDYKRMPGFASSPLGKCIARAGGAVRAPAYGGDYIYFGLRHDEVPDPMANVAARLDQKAAELAVSALDDEARDCTQRSPAGSRPGESVRILVFFEGATGKVSKVEPYYVDTRSAYGRCLAAVYRKATVDKFREIEQKVLHVLAP
jgi:hypothetical protein